MVVYNQIVTWTAFAILAMFERFPKLVIRANDYKDDMGGDDEENGGGGDDELVGNFDDGVDVPPAPRK